VFAQELYSLVLNKTLELHLNTIEDIVFEFSILYIIHNILYILYYILYIMYNILYIVYFQTKVIKNFHKKIHKKEIQQRISKRHLSIARDRQG
jgi:predicted membrane protein